MTVPRQGAGQRLEPPSATGAKTVPWAVELHGRGQVGGEVLRLLGESGVPLAALHRSRAVLRHDVVARRTVVVDATPPRLAGPPAEAWVAFLERTLLGGIPVVTCNKAPLALAWARLDAAAKAGGVPLVATGTVGGGTPILPTLRALHARRPVQRIEATLSGTLGVVVPAVKAGASLADAVAAAQRAGFCEPDPTVDLDGTDAWAKACILHDALWPQERPLGLADRPGPLRLDEAAVRRLRSPAVVATLRPGLAELRLQEWDGGGGAAGIQVLAHVAGGSVTLSGPGAGPAATAAAVVADVHDVVAGRLAPGIQ